MQVCHPRMLPRLPTTTPHADKEMESKFAPPATAAASSATPPASTAAARALSVQTDRGCKPSHPILISPRSQRRTAIENEGQEQHDYENRISNECLHNLHYSYLMDHKPFPLYVIGERYSVFLSDVDEQVLSKLYKGRTDVVVRIKKTYDEEECLPYYKKEDFISNQQVNESTAEKNRDSSFFIAFKGGVTCLALLVWVCIVISSGGSGFLSIVPIGGFLAWLWDKSK